MTEMTDKQIRSMYRQIIEEMADRSGEWESWNKVTVDALMQWEGFDSVEEGIQRLEEDSVEPRHLGVEE